MIRTSTRNTHPGSWRSLRRAAVIPALPLMAWGCLSHPLTQPNPEPGMQTNVYVTVAKNPSLDLVIMVDNSPSMAPKVGKMNAQFPKLIEALKDPNDGSLPDLRVAIIDSDLGTNGAYPPGQNSCSVQTLPDGTQSNWGDMGRFQMRKRPQPCTFTEGALFLEHKAGRSVNYEGDISTVFACLASNLGTAGCGQEHPLQAFEWALAAKGVGNEAQQRAFLRAHAYLGLVFLTDEDDCSAATNDRLFGDLPDDRGDAASLRCATRAHKCGGQNLNDFGPHYPTTATYTHAFADCRPRIGDECGLDVDTSQPTACNPLRNVVTLADELKRLKRDPDSQILVAGIFGWPIDDAAMARAEYKIAPVPNPNTADLLHPTVYDYWPVCYDPDHPPSSPDPATGFDIEAAGWGATGGLRNAAFVDEFGENGLKFSICQRDFSDSMRKIGDAIAGHIYDLCVNYKLVDTDTQTPGVQADCRVVWRIPRQDPGDPTQVIYDESPTSLPQCADGSTNGNVPTDCWQLTRDQGRCEVTGQLINVLRTAQEIREQPQLSPGTRIAMQCSTCTDPFTVINPDPSRPRNLQPGCDYVF
jgi:hypothetical protein